LGGSFRGWEEESEEGEGVSRRGFHLPLLSVSFAYFSARAEKYVAEGSKKKKVTSREKSKTIPKTAK